MAKDNISAMTGKGHDMQFSKKRIQELRAAASHYQKANNKLVDKLWKLDHALIDTTDNDYKSSLLKKKTTLCEEFDRADYPEKINKLLEQIKKLEIELYGHSDMEGNSPYKL